MTSTVTVPRPPPPDHDFTTRRDAHVSATVVTSTQAPPE